MVEEQLFRIAEGDAGSITYGPAGGKTPTGVSPSQHPNALVYETGTRPNGSEFRLEIEDNGIYNLEVIESPWKTFYEEDSDITGNVEKIGGYQNLNNNLRTINWEDDTEKLDNFIDLLVDRELRTNLL